MIRHFGHRCFIAAAIPLHVALSGCQIESPGIYDPSRDYYLPFRKGTASLLAQGYNGAFSHSGDFSLDFAMLEGTPISAARSGRVVEVVEQHTGACPITRDCSNNRLIINHLDGSLGVYLHMQQNSVCVQLNDWVNQGDLIALSGNVGFSTMPHLHFEVRYQTGHTPIAPTFADVNVGGSGIPIAARTYVSSNPVGHNFCL